MRILVDIGHPAHVHLFKHFIWQMKQKGHDIMVTARDKEVLLQLLSRYGFKYTELKKPGNGLFGLAIELLQRDYDLFFICKTFKPDIMTGLSENITHVGRILGIPSIVYTDTEHAKLFNLMMVPWANAICTPSCFRKNFGRKHIRYDGYHELAYLHPNYFTPSKDVLDELDLTKDDSIIVIRFVSWKASHDVGQRGINDKVSFVKELQRYGNIIITSEGLLPDELIKFKIKVSPEKLHDLLYYSTLYVGEGATIASECAVLGTHAVYVNTLRLGYTDEEEYRYGLVNTCSEEKTLGQDALEKAKKLLENENLKKEGKQKGKRLLNDKIDVTSFMIWLTENFPDSIQELREHPEIQKDFR